MCFGVVWIDRLPKFTSFTVTLILLISSGKNEIVSTLAMKSDEKENGRKDVCNVVTSECIFSMSNCSMLLNKSGCFLFFYTYRQSSSKQLYNLSLRHRSQSESTSRKSNNMNWSLQRP